MEKYTKYEKARILGARALQLAMNAPILINISKEKLEDVNYDPLKIAQIEFDADILPISVKRPFPKKEEEEEELEDEVIKEETEQPVEKPEVVEEKTKVEEEAEPVEAESPELEI